MIRAAGKKAGIVLNPDTPIDRVMPYLDRIDAVLLMSVFPGFGGQEFIPATLGRLTELKRLIAGRSIAIWVDGGIGPDNCAPAAEAGADVVVSGSAIFRSRDYAAAIARLKGNR
jgi:ribulose-phosphate 3-epimerase